MFPSAVVNTPLLGLALSVIIYSICEIVVARLKLKLCPPLLPAIIIIMLMLLYIPGISFKQYFIGASFLNFFLGPATIALGLPLYKNRHIVKENAAVIITSVLFGTFLALGSIYALGKFTGLSGKVLISVMPKSVTTPIAIEISKTIGGIPPITTAVVIITGIFGAAVNHKLLNIFHIKNDMASGIAIGLSSHALGTSVCAPVSAVQLAVSSVSLGLTAIATSIIAPILLPILISVW